MPTNNALRVSFIGAGRMATALAKGLINAGFVPAERIQAADTFSAAREAFQSETGCTAGDSNTHACTNADVVFLAVKPQQMADVLTELKTVVTAEQLVISIAAGVPISQITNILGEANRIVRVMPNTPSLVGAAAAGFALGGAASAEDGQLVERLLSTVGLAVAVPEKLLDAVTGLSGSGPAYVYQVIEAMSDGGVRMGLPRDVATKLAAQTVLGAARMVLETGQHPGLLKDAVTSPGGTTIAGVHALENGGLRACLMNAVQAATLRSIELGQSS